MFNLVDAAPLAPNGCMICGSAKAPLLDLMQEFSAQQLRLYLCKTHAREIVRAFGWVKGERLDKLENAAAEIEQVAKDRDSAMAAGEKLAEEVTRLQQRLMIVERERDTFRDREESQRFRLTQLVSQTNELLIGAGGDN